jgi:acyl-CoA dehydrogenase
VRNFTDEQTLFRESYRRFLADEIAPHIETWREQNIVDREAFAKAGALGFLMIWPDEQYGGLGDPDFRYEQIIIEETQRAGCGEWYNSLHSRLVGPYLEKFGNEEQKQRFLPKCVSGETILAIAMTEPGAGSDLSGIRTYAEEKDDHFVLNGSKTYISNGINADLVIVAAKCAPDDDPYSMVLLLVERGMAGFERGRNLDKMGLKAQDTAELFFNDVKVPRVNVLGVPGKGFHYLMEGLAEERLIGAVQCAANARRAFDLTRDFVMERKAFGQRLSDLQNTQFRMAELDAEIDVIQVYLDHLVAVHNRGELTANMGAKAKMQATEVEWRMVDQGVQLHGGAGYMKEYPICSMFTDARVNRILAGSSEIMRYIIGRDVFSQRYKSFLE